MVNVVWYNAAFAFDLHGWPNFNDCTKNLYRPGRDTMTQCLEHIEFVASTHCNIVL